MQSIYKENCLQTYLKTPHYEGMSTDDELPSQEQANVAKVRQDVENQVQFPNLIYLFE